MYDEVLNSTNRQKGWIPMKREQGTDERTIFCSNVKWLRQKHRLTKQQMAAIMGIGVYSITKLEQGNLPPRMRIDAALNLSHHFRIPLKYLFYVLLQFNNTEAL